MPDKRHYNHADWELQRAILRFLLRTIGFTLWAKLGSAEGMENIPDHGPIILMINHIAFIDPIVVMHVLKRNIVPMAKIEVYNYPFIGIFPRLWGVIPVRREEFDRRAVQMALEVLHAGEIILVAPEGTRSPQLQHAKEGVAYIAAHTFTPIVPVAIDGTPGFPAFRTSPTWRQPGAQLRFGRPFHFRPDLQHAGRDVFRKMTDEAMYVLSALLPPHRRGVYADLSQATQDTIEWGLKPG